MQAVILAGGLGTRISEESLLRSNPKVASLGEDKIRIARANFFFRMNRHQQAISELEASYAFNPTIEIARDIGYGHYLLGNKAEALNWLRIAITTRQPLFEENVSPNKDDIQKAIIAIEQEIISNKKNSSVILLKYKREYFLDY